MFTETRIKEDYNEVDDLTAVCNPKTSWSLGEYPELEIGKTLYE